MEFEEFYTKVRGRIQKEQRTIADRLQRVELHTLYTKIGAEHNPEQIVQQGIEGFLYGLKLGTILSLRSLFQSRPQELEQKLEQP